MVTILVERNCFYSSEDSLCVQLHCLYLNPLMCLNCLSPCPTVVALKRIAWIPFGAEVEGVGTRTNDLWPSSWGLETPNQLMPRNTRVDGEKPSHTECKQIKSIQRLLSFSLIQNPFHSHSPYPREENGRSDHTRVAFPIHTINHRRMVTRGPFLLSLLVYLVLRVRLALAFRGCGVSVGQIQAGGGIGHVGAGSREGGRKNKRRS